ncbi:MAG: hypothetical protein Fur0018_22510 [Anaerolineales bacterium]
MEHYGHIDRDGYPLAAWIWGHRLRIGQHWMEYLLEFLNVLAGFEYELGQGVDGASKQEYIRFTRLGLRRFVFYDEREKTRHPYDDAARTHLLAVLQQQVVPTDGDAQSALDLTRSLLRAFSAVEEQRSWYAKSLFPAHHNLLFWEALRKGATKNKGRSVSLDTPPQLLDAEIAFDARNFFARGGELYYLILSAGTENAPDRRQRIAARLRELLNEHNQPLGLLAEIIDQAWQTKPVSGNGHDKTGRLGWLPDPQCPLYRLVAEDTDTFLQADLDPLETLDLLAHLIGFYLTLYIYHRAHPKAASQHHADGSCGATCRLALLVDAMDGADGGVIREVSAALFREQEARILHKGGDYVRQQVESWAIGVADGALAPRLDSEARAHFNLSGLHKRSLNPFTRRVDALLSQFNDGSLDRDGFIAGYADALTDLLLRDFRKNFIGVHRKLSKAVGFVAPLKGPGARFVLGDNLLKALTLANIPPGSGMTYDAFLARLYERYGLVIGPVEVRESGLLERQRINAEYYDRNRAALLEKMKHAGLAVEYSDATAVVGG